MMDRKRIGYVRAVVEMPLYEGDPVDDMLDFPCFMYVTSGCVRPADTVLAEVCSLAAEKEAVAQIAA